MNTEGLISVLEANESITHVYFDKNGGWLFVPNVLHPIVKTREEVLDAYLQYSLVEQTKEENADSQQDPPLADNAGTENADSQQDPPLADNAGKGTKKSK